VFFTILLVTGNTMSQSVRERTGELGLLKALGFTSAQTLSLVLAESCMLAVLGGGIGLGVALLLIARGDPTGGMLPLFYFPTLDVLTGVGFSIALGRGGRHLPRPPSHASPRSRRPPAHVAPNPMNIQHPTSNPDPPFASTAAPFGLLTSDFPYVAPH
jgi:hypothetical protein